MISIIICSINKAFAEQVQKNIDQTIGVVWEPIIIDNIISPKSITQVYNIGAAKATYDILCFVHEDILFKTQQWGIKLVEHFANDKELGLIGIAGSKYKSKTPSGWFTGIPEFECCNILHLDSSGNEQNIYFNPVPNSLSQDVIVLDGVFLCCPKSIWKEIQFDEVLLKDFHLYDVDFSFRVTEKYKAIVSFEINIIHLTQGGSFGNKWVEYTLLWHEKMKGKLPACTIKLPLKEKQIEKQILKLWLIRLKHENIKLSNKLNWLRSIKIFQNFSAWPYTLLFLVKKYFKK